MPHISIAEQLNAMAELSPSSVQDIIHDFPHQDPVAASGPPHNEIAVRAREIFIEEGRPQGQSDEIWRRAELEKRDKECDGPACKKTRG